MSFTGIRGIGKKQGTILPSQVGCPNELQACEKQKSSISWHITNVLLNPI